MLHGIGGDGGNIAETVLVEVAHRQITQVLGDLNSLDCRSAVTCFTLEHGGEILYSRAADDTDHADPKATPNRGSGDFAADDRRQHQNDGWYLQRFKQCHYNAQRNGLMELLFILRSAEVKEFIQNLKHGRHLLLQYP